MKEEKVLEIGGFQFVLSALRGVGRFHLSEWTVQSADEMGFRTLTTLDFVPWDTPPRDRFGRADARLIPQAHLIYAGVDENRAEREARFEVALAEAHRQLEVWREEYAKLLVAEEQLLAAREAEHQILWQRCAAEDERRKALTSEEKKGEIAKGNCCPVHEVKGELCPGDKVWDDLTQSHDPLSYVLKRYEE